MSGSIIRALNWDVGYEQQFLAVNPLGDEVLLYQTHHDNPNKECNDMVKVSSRGGFENIQCSSYSLVQNGITGVGTINGSISVFDINSNTSSILNLKPKQERPCNTISFNRNNLIVGGFDKGRQDNSLQIWNIEHYSNTSDNYHIKRPVSSYLPNEAILSTKFYPDNENGILCGSYKYLREIDLRTDSPVFQMATKCTLGITIDHFKNHLFYSASEDGSLVVWDRRKLTSNNSKFKTSSNLSVITEAPILHFNKLLIDSTGKNINSCVRSSTIRSGEFSAVFNGDLIRRWHTGMVPQSNISVDHRFKNQRDTLQSLKQQSLQLYKPHEESLFVSLVLDVKTYYERVISYDYSPDILSNTSTNFVCMRQSGTVFRMPVVESIDAIDFNSYNEFTIAGHEGTLTHFLSGKDVPEVSYPLTMQKENRSLSNAVYSEDGELSNFEGSAIEHFDHEEAFTERLNGEESIPLKNFLKTSEVISNDICCTIRNRAILGYSVDALKNIEILDKLDSITNPASLKNTWRWVSLAKKSLDKGIMVSRGVDLGFQGILGIWCGVDEIQQENRMDTGIGSLTDRLFSEVVDAIVLSKGKKSAGINILSKSERNSQRKLCLIVSGWYLTDDEFDEKLAYLISLGQYEKAAGWAVFHGDVTKAIEILASSKKERLRLMSTAVAGYLAYKDSVVNSPWKDQCRKMASELDDPYLRAIFAFIADNDWWDVLDEGSLPLKERLGVALRFLSDKDLTLYLNRIAETVVRKGELDGLILTGITKRGIDLLQSYVDRSSDIQTAALIASFACPRYFTDKRIDHWIDCYRNLLNSWKLFNIRAKFDVARTKLSKTNSGQITLKPVPKQVYLQCIRCNKNLSKTKPNVINNKSAGSNNPTILMKHLNKMNLQTKQRTDLKICPHCGSPLPRCSICLLTLGTPIPFESSEMLPESSMSNKIENKFREWFSFCLNCNHGAHAYHAEEWFSKHYVCPVPDCNCRCNSR